MRLCQLDVCLTLRSQRAKRFLDVTVHRRRACARRVPERLCEGHAAQGRRTGGHLAFAVRDCAAPPRAVRLKAHRPGPRSMDADPAKLKWERKKKAGYAPSARSGCSMTLWASKGMGVLFGGVFDDDESEEDMKSTFYNDL